VHFIRTFQFFNTQFFQPTFFLNCHTRITVISCGLYKSVFSTFNFSQFSCISTKRELCKHFFLIKTEFCSFFPSSHKYKRFLIHFFHCFSFVLDLETKNTSSQPICFLTSHLLSIYKCFCLSVCRSHHHKLSKAIKNSSIYQTTFLYPHQI